MNPSQTDRDLKGDPVADPLYRCIVDPPSGPDYGATTRHLIAYRSITLIPSSFVDGRVPANLDHPEGSVRMTIKEGSLTSPNISIHAERIYLHPGSRFSFPGKNLTITASKFITLPAVNDVKGKKYDKVVFDCSGQSPDPPGIAPNQPKSNPGFVRIDKGLFNHGWRSGPASPGTEGVRGEDGASGGSGGQITICGQMFGQPGETISLLLNVQGGRGAPGSTGGRGGDAGDIQLTDCDENAHATIYDGGRYFVDDRGKPKIEDLRANGGNGGAGGVGGKCGKGGAISLSITSDGNFRYEKGTVEGVIDMTGAPRGQGGPGGYGSFITGGVWSTSRNRTGQKGSDGLPAIDFNSVPFLTHQDLAIFKDFAFPKVKQLTDAEALSFADPVQLMMVTQRLLFEYQMCFGTQLMTASQTADTQQGKDFAESLEWLSEKISAHNAAKSGETDTWLQARLALKQLVRTANAHLDMYNNTLEVVEDPNISLASVEADIQYLDVLEKTRNAIADKLAKIDSKAEDIRQAAQELFDDNSNFEVQRIAQQKAIQDQYEIVDQGNQQVVFKRDALVKDLNDFWKAAQKYFTGCTGWEGVLNAVGSVMMFAPESEKARDAITRYAVGSAFSLAGAASSVETDVDPDDHTVNAKYFGRKIYSIEEEIEDLQTAITSARSDSLSLNGPDPNMITTIIADRQKFLDLCDGYYGKIDGIEKTKAGFDDFIAAVQESKSQVVKYNELAVEYFKFLEDHKISKLAWDTLANNNVSLASPQLDLVFSFFTHAYTKKKASTIHRLYQGVRAYNCASMSRSEAFDRIAELGSFDTVTADKLETAFKGTLADEINDLIGKINSAPRTGTGPGGGIGSVMTPKNSPFTFEQLFKNRSFSFAPSITEKEELGMDRGWYDIRLEDFRIFLDGAKLMNETERDKVINLSIKFAGRFDVQDDHFVDYDFEVPELETSYSYNYSQAPSYTTTSSSELPWFQYDLNGSISKLSTQGRARLASPFTRWHIGIGDEVDITNVTAIRIEMDIRHRTKEVNASSKAAITNRALPKSTLLANGAVDKPAIAHIDSAEGFVSDALRISGQFLRTIRPYRISPVAFALENRTRYDVFSRVFKKFNTRYTYKPLEHPRVGPFSSYGVKPGEQAQRVIDAVRSGDQLTAKLNIDLHNYAERLLAQQPADDSGFNATSSASLTVDGHEASFMGKLPAMTDTQASLLMDLNHGPAIFLTSFPYARVRIIPQNLSSSFETAEDQRAWIRENQDAIDDHTEDCLKNGADIRNSYVVLGDAALIKVVHLAKTHNEATGVTAVHLVAATTSLHPLNGINAWSYVRDAKGRFYAMNNLSGLHILITMDAVNNVVAESLMGVTYSTIKPRMEALEQNMELHDYMMSKPEYKDIVNSRRLATVVDRTLGTMMSLVRQGMGADTAVDITPRKDTDIQALADIAKGNFPETKEVRGMYYDGVPVLAASVMTLQDCSTAGDNPLNPLTVTQRDVARRIVIEESRYNLDRPTLDTLQSSIIQTVEDHLPSPDAPPPTASDSTTSIYNSMLPDPSFSDAIHTHVRSLVDDETMASIKDKIFSEPSFSTLRDADLVGDFGACVTHIANEHVLRHVVAEMVRPGGLVEMWATSRIETYLEPQLSSFDAKAALTKAQDVVSNRKAELAKAQEARDKLPENDRDIMQAEAAVKREEEALKEAEGQVDNVQELDSIKSGDKERKKRKEKEEQEERDRMFERPEGE